MGKLHERMWGTGYQPPHSISLTLGVQMLVVLSLLFSMIARLVCEFISLPAIYVAACSNGWAEPPFRVSDPGVRPVATDMGAALSGIDADVFAKARYAFREV